MAIYLLMQSNVLSNKTSCECVHGVFSPPNSAYIHNNKHSIHASTAYRHGMNKQPRRTCGLVPCTDRANGSVVFTPDIVCVIYSELHIFSHTFKSLYHTDTEICFYTRPKLARKSFSSERFDCSELSQCCFLFVALRERRGRRLWILA